MGFFGHPEGIRMKHPGSAGLLRVSPAAAAGSGALAAGCFLLQGHDQACSWWTERELARGAHSARSSASPIDCMAGRKTSSRAGGGPLDRFGEVSLGSTDGQNALSQKG